MRPARLDPRRLADRARARRFDRDVLVERFAPGASFADIGCMWNISGAIAFLAEERGATAVTGLDLMPRTPAFDAEHARRSSAVRFVQGDLHDPAVTDEVGVHDIVWCSGLIYHAPDPMLTLRALRSITGKTLLIGSEVTREGRAPRQVTFAPGPDVHPKAPASFEPAQGYGGWWWGFSPSALAAMCRAAGLEVREQHGTRWYRVLVAEPR